MEIRNAEEGDIPAIVELLKISLGESLMPKSEAFWRWKHVENPFGVSPVLLAFEGEQLIGVRAFMRWEWRQGDKIYKAVRAVDTATHPKHQGKGIFKKLTLQLVDQCASQGIDFIFNTPNKSSKPGYLKMGWSEVGRLPLYLRPIVTLKKPSENFESDFRLTLSRCDQLTAGIHPHSTFLETNRSAEYLRWRYVANPNISYYSFRSSEGRSWVIFRLKPGRWGTEFRICEFLMDAPVNLSDFRQSLLNVVRASGASFVSFSGASSPLKVPGLALGPMVTLRPLARHNSLTFEKWKPTLGDLEVF